MKGALKKLNEVLGPKYGYDPTDDRALATWDMVKSSQVTTNILIGIQIFLGIVGALTLLIGGVGVANIMYAVVKERTREIGVKMALGARSGDGSSCRSSSKPSSTRSSAARSESRSRICSCR